MTHWWLMISIVPYCSIHSWPTMMLCTQHVGFVHVKASLDLWGSTAVCVCLLTQQTCCRGNVVVERCLPMFMTEEYWTNCSKWHLVQMQDKMNVSVTFTILNCSFTISTIEHFYKWTPFMFSYISCFLIVVCSFAKLPLCLCHNNNNCGHYYYH